MANSSIEQMLDEVSDVSVSILCLLVPLMFRDRCHDFGAKGEGTQSLRTCPSLLHKAQKE